MRSGGLSASGAETLARLIGPTERYPAAEVISSDAPGPRMKWIVRGWACERRALPDGRRQIFLFAIPGDPVLSQPAAAGSPYSLVAITIVECIDVAQVLARAPEPSGAEISRAMTQALHIAKERRYDQLARLALPSPTQRLADLLIELHDRLGRIGMVDSQSFLMPLTQEQLADALGLSVGRVNRSVRALRLAQLVNVHLGRVTGFDRERLDALRRATTG